MPSKWDNRAVRASRQMRQEKFKALGSHSLEEPLRASEKLSFVMEQKMLMCFMQVPPADPEALH